MPVQILFALLLLVFAGSCASGLAGAAVRQSGAREVVLARGASQRVANTDLTVFFDTVVEDSRCPRGVNCVWAGDAAVRVRIEEPGAPPATHTLHTNDGFQREFAHDDLRVELASLTPEPTTEGPPRPDDYRVTLLIRRK